MTSRLFDAGRKPHPRFDPSAPHAVVHVPGHRCPRCGSPTVADVARQDALFWLHGRGGTVRTTRRSCPLCLWAGTPDTADERPPRRPRP